jgi:hypothetical protein
LFLLREVDPVVAEPNISFFDAGPIR